MIACFGCGTAAGGYREAVSGGRMTGYKPLQPARRAKPLHAPLSFSKRQMAVLGPIVKAFVGAMLKAGSDLASGRTVGAQLVRDDPFGKAKPLDQRFQSRFAARFSRLNFRISSERSPIGQPRARARISAPRSSPQLRRDAKRPPEVPAAGASFGRSAGRISQPNA